MRLGLGEGRKDGESVGYAVGAAVAIAVGVGVGRAVGEYVGPLDIGNTVTSNAPEHALFQQPPLRVYIWHPMDVFWGTVY